MDIRQKDSSSNTMFTFQVMYAPSKPGDQPSVEVSKEFMMSPNKLHLGESGFQES